MFFNHKPTLEKDDRISQECDFLTWTIKNSVGQFVRKYYITWLIDLANKFYDIEKFLISFYAIKIMLLKIALLY